MAQAEWIVYTDTEQDSDQNYGPYAHWEYDSRQPDPRNGETAEREVYRVVLEGLAHDENVAQFRDLVERKLNVDRCVVFWQEADAPTSSKGVFVGTTSDGQHDVYVPYDALIAERENVPEAEWPTADDWAADFNGRGEAVVVPHA